MAINHNQVVYIPKGEHDNPYELPKQHDLEGSTYIGHTLYSHSDIIVPMPNSLQKLDYIYQHFHDNEKIYESDPNLVSSDTDNTLYSHINNNIEYGLFEDIIDSYYLDSQIKDNFTCDQNCYTRTQHKQQDQTLTPCTHVYDHITQHIDNLEDPTQQHTAYTKEVDASLFTMDTTTPCNYNISPDILNSDKVQENKINNTQPMGIHSQSKHKYRNVFGDSSNITILIMVMHSLSKTNILHYYNKNYKTLIGVCTIQLQSKAIKYLLKWTQKLCHMLCIFPAIKRLLLRLTKSLTR